MSLSLILLIIRLMIAAPQIYKFVKDLIELIKLIRDPKVKAMYESRLREVVKSHLNRRTTERQVSAELMILKSELEEEIKKQG